VAHGPELAGELRAAGWELHGQVGRSPHSVVYRATKGGAEYALKVMRDHLDGGSVLAAYRREAAMVAAVGHPGLPEVYEVGQAGPWPYLAMELLTGRSLGVALESGPLEVAAAVQLAAAVARTLGAAHRANMVHRDVKPDNIVFDRAGRPRLIDFGLAGTVTAPADTESPAEPSAVGTLRYSSPEQSGMLKRPVDHRSDLYSLGVVLFECLAGRPPFTASEAGELLRAHAVAAPPALADLRPDVPPALAAIAATLLAKDPDDRYRGADGVVADLERVAAGEADFPLRRADDLQPVRGDRELVGVATELALLGGCWRQATGGSGQVLLVRGGLGSGKSRMLRELARGAHHDGRPVLNGQCVAGSPVPFGPLREAVEGYLELLRRDPDPEQGLARVRQAAGAGGGLAAPLSPALASLLAEAGEPVAEDGNPADDTAFASAVAAFLAELARLCDGLLLCLDDVHLLDEASARVLRRVAEEVPRAPLLVACAGLTERPAGGGADPLARFRAAVGALDVDLELPVLPDDAVAQLLAMEFGAPADPAVVASLAAFTRNNPYGLVTTARTLIFSGLVRPHWGRAVVNEEALDQVDLPPDVRSMIAARLDLLGAGFPLLAAAAAIGDRFELEVLLRLAVAPQDAVLRLVTLTVDWRLIEQAGPDTYRFVHHWVRDMVLDRVDPAERRRLHQRIAAVTDTGEVGADPRSVYELAGHYTRGDLATSPARAFEVCWAAARAALADHAAADAAAYLDTATRAAALAAITPPSRFDATVAMARFAAGELDEAARRLELALAAETELTVRVELLDQLARVEYVRPNFAAMATRSEQALAELGQPVPRSARTAALVTVWALLRALAALLPGRFGGARGQRRERYLAQLRVIETASRAAYQMRPTYAQVALAARGFVAANRVGRGPEYVLGHLVTASALMTLRRLRLCGAVLARARAEAVRLGDPRLLARAAVWQAYRRTALGDDIGGARLMRRAVLEQGRWLPTEVYIESAMAAAVQLDIRGYAREAEELRLLAVERGLPVPTFLSPSVVVGHAEEPDQQVALARHLLAADGAPWQAVGPLVWCGLMHAAAFVLRERDDLGPACEEVLASMLRHAPQGRTLRPYFRRLWMTVAYIRLAQVDAPGADRPGALERARSAVAVYGRLVRISQPLAAHHLVAKAWLELLEGRPKDTLNTLVRADRLAETADVPWARYESAMVRARALSELGEPAAAGVAADFALLLAERHGWVHRAARVRREFGTTGTSHSTAETRGVGGSGTAGHSASSLRDRRYLDGLLQVSVAAASVLEPRELARVALDELLKVFGAERAYLFGCQGDGAPLERYAGRDAAGNDLSDLVGYSTTLVERARSERRAMVVTGTEQGAAAGSRSAVTYGLRSIMVAPLQFEGRLLGVVYLDSRVATGIFGAGDQEILVAVASQVATALEKARAAQLEVQVQAERRQRELADDLREAAARLSGTLDPDEVLELALTLAATMVDADAGAVLIMDGPITGGPITGDGARVAAVYGRAATAAERASGPELAVGSPVLLPPLLREPEAEPAGGTVSGRDAGQLPGALHVLLGRPRGWLAIPLTARGARFGLLLLASRALGGGAEAQPGIAAALAAQAATAYDNARLFRQVEQLARTDGLTGLDNRRHFMELAARELAGRHAPPLAAIMLDIDHFKRVNDSYGHAAGDVVIRAVAHRVAGSLRSGDLLCRYGGEEFAILARGDGPEIRRLAERLRRVVEAEPVRTEAGALTVTVSVGTAPRRATDSGPDPVLARADAALYRAKEAGRNRVACAEPAAEAVHSGQSDVV
jgi:eukaryotic-like serine/threonine-protein kinase